jgi:hypothetical protein
MVEALLVEIGRGQEVVWRDQAELLVVVEEAGAAGDVMEGAAEENPRMQEKTGRGPRRKHG